MKTLRRRLAALYTVTTGSILILVMAAFFLSSVRESKNAGLDQFQVIWNSLTSRFQSSNAYSHGYLAQTEADYQTIIHIQENGIPFRYQGSWAPATDRDILIDRAIKLAKAQGVSTDTAPVSSTMNLSSLMTIEGDAGDQYYARVLSLSMGKTLKSICVISYIPPISQSLGQTLPYLCLLGIFSLLGLWLISWCFVGWSLKPVEESRKKQAQFMAAASHELRSPLAVLKSAAQTMIHTPSETASLLPLMDQECSRMSRLVDDMLLLASVDAKTWSIYKEEIDMDTLLIDLYESYEPACKEKELSLHLELPQETLPKIQGDPDRIRQVLFILLDNAKNYTPAGRSITIKAFMEQSGREDPLSLPARRILASFAGRLPHGARVHKKHALILQVEDQGCGIPDEHKPYIFDRFYQADSARTDKQHFGLGLSVAKELVELHHGTISVKDGNDGGSCFVVTLPC